MKIGAFGVAFPMVAIAIGISAVIGYYWWTAILITVLACLSYSYARMIRAEKRVQKKL